MKGILKLRRNFIKNRIRELRSSGVLKHVFFGSIGVVFMAGLYMFFLKAFMYIKGVPLIGPVLITKLLAMIFLAFWIMLIFSDVVTAFSTIYFSDDMPMLLSMPIPNHHVFIYKFFETAFYSSWMIFIIFFVIILAYGVVFKAGLLFYLFVFLLFVPFVLLASSSGIFFSIILMRLFPSKKTRDILIILGIIFSGSAYLVFRLLQPEKLVRADELESVFEYLTTLKTPTAFYLPSYWLTRGIAFVTRHRMAEYFAYLGILAGSSVAALTVNVFLSKHIFYEGWVRAQEGSGSSSRISVWSSALFKILGIFPEDIQAMFKKDIRLFFRDTTQWSQFFLLGAIITVYLFNIYKLPLDTPFLKTLVSFLNILAAGFVISAIALRFAYPSVSMEGKSFWIIRAAPMGIARFMTVKFLLVFFPLLAIELIIVYFSNLLLDASLFIQGLSLINAFLVTFALTGLAIGVGASYPRFRIENIAQIESSFGGLVYMFLSLFYLIIIIGIEVIPLRGYIQYGFFMNRVPSPGYFLPFLVLIVVISLITGILPYRIGIKRLMSYEDL